jgi:hypothetical protein
LGSGQTVKLTEDTHFPLEEEVRFTLNTDQPTTFPLYLRIPAWAEGATAMLNGSPVETQLKAGAYLRISREWKDNDQLTLTLPMHISSQVWEQNKSSVSVNYGPLTLSLRIDERYVQRDSSDPAIVQDDSHWQESVDKSLWPAYEIFADSPWNYSLKVDEQKLPVDIQMSRRPWPADNYPFTLESVPLQFTAVGRRIPSWGLDATGMTDLLPTKFAGRADKEEPIQLIPMGAARLRITAFPQADVSRFRPDCDE